MCDEISILENFWMFVRSVAQYFVRIVAQYQYQAIVIYTRFSTEIDISLFANNLPRFKNITSYFCLLVGILTLFRSLQIRCEVQKFIIEIHKPVCKNYYNILLYFILCIVI